MYIKYISIIILGVVLLTGILAYAQPMNVNAVDVDTIVGNANCQNIASDNVPYVYLPTGSTAQPITR